MVLLAMFVLASCARTGTGSKDNLALRGVAAATGTKIFVKNALRSGRLLMHVSLNDIKAGELGESETIAVDVPVGENTVKVEYVGLSGSHLKPGVVRKFSMEKNQKRFILSQVVDVHVLLYRKLGLIEVPADEFFRH